MTELFIADLDDEVTERLKQRARGNGRTIEAETRAILEEVAAGQAGFEEPVSAEAALLPRNTEQGLGDVMYEHFKDRGLTDEEFARFNEGIAEISSRSAMRIPDFEADEFEEWPSNK
jgi:plasmid stability protein